MPCENQKACDFYKKMLPLFKEVLYDSLPQFRPTIDYISEVCKTGMRKREESFEECDNHKYKICEKYPNCAIIKSRTILWFKEALMETSINVCLLKKGHCMHELEGITIEDIEKDIENFSKMLIEK